MPLGDSLTDGFNVPGGYRIELERLLDEASRPFDFVGSRQNGPAALADRDHEGWSGYTIDQVRASFASWFAASPADVVLLMVGTNDLKLNDPAIPDDAGAAAARLGELLTEITEIASSTHVIVSTVPPPRVEPGTSQAAAFNLLLPGVVADAVSDGRSVSLADGASVLSDADFSDALHLNALGYSRLAHVWFAALSAYLGGPVPPPGSGGVVGFDGFGRANSSSLGSADVGGVWVGSGGARFGVSGGAGAVVSGTGEGVALLDVGVADVSVESVLTLSSGRASPGVSVRASDSRNQLLVSVVRRPGEDRVSLFKVDGGVYGALASRDAMGFVLGESYVLRVDVVGSVVRVFVDGVLSFEYVLSGGDAVTFGSRTGVGLRTFRSANADDGGSRWNSIEISSLEGGGQ